MDTATIVVGNVSPLARQEIAGLGGEVRQLGDSPLLFLVQIPGGQLISIPPANGDRNTLQEARGTKESASGRNDAEAEGQWLLSSGEWMGAYRQHPSDVTQAELRSPNDPPLEYGRTEREERENLLGIGREILRAIRERTLTPYTQHLWNVAHDLASFPGHEPLRRGLQASITLGAPDAPPVREALAEVRDELASLPEEERLLRLGKLVAQLVTDALEAQALLAQGEQEALNQFELGLRLQALRAGLLTAEEVADAVKDWGTANFLEAHPEVERCLGHSDQEIRLRALETLTLHWQLDGYRDTTMRFLHDPDPHCRHRAMLCLNPDRQPIEDESILRLYAQVIADASELPDLRLAAYRELLTATGYSLDDFLWMEMERHVKAGGAFEQHAFIDWSLIQFFLTETNAACSYQATLRGSELPGGNEWVDSHGRAFYAEADLLDDVILRAHQIFTMRCPYYRMTISFSPLVHMLISRDTRQN